jgi:hypothetical protein
VWGDENAADCAGRRSSVTWAFVVFPVTGRLDICPPGAAGPERWVELCRNAIAREPGDHTVARACVVTAWMNVGASSPRDAQ